MKKLGFAFFMLIIVANVSFAADYGESQATDCVNHPDSGRGAASSIVEDSRPSQSTQTSGSAAEGN